METEGLLGELGSELFGLFARGVVIVEGEGAVDGGNDVETAVC